MCHLLEIHSPWQHAIMTHWSHKMQSLIGNMPSIGDSSPSDTDYYYA